MSFKEGGPRSEYRAEQLAILKSQFETPYIQRKLYSLSEQDALVVRERLTQLFEEGNVLEVAKELLWRDFVYLKGLYTALDVIEQEYGYTTPSGEHDSNDRRLAGMTLLELERIDGFTPDEVKNVISHADEDREFLSLALGIPPRGDGVGWSMKALLRFTQTGLRAIKLREHIQNNEGLVLLEKRLLNDLRMPFVTSDGGLQVLPGEKVLEAMTESTSIRDLKNRFDLRQDFQIELPRIMREKQEDFYPVGFHQYGPRQDLRYPSLLIDRIRIERRQ